MAAWLRLLTDWQTACCLPADGRPVGRVGDRGRMHACYDDAEHVHALQMGTARVSLCKASGLPGLCKWPGLCKQVRRVVHAAHLHRDKALGQ